MSARLEGSAEVRSLMQGFARYMLREGERALKDTGDAIVDRARENLEGGRTGPRRIDSGATQETTSRSPARRRGMSLETEIGPTTPWAPHVHWGTSRMAPNRFLAEAGEHHAPELQERLKERILAYWRG